MNYSRSTTPTNEIQQQQQQQQQQQAAQETFTHRHRLGPGIVLHARSASPPSRVSPQPQSLQHQQQHQQQQLSNAATAMTGAGTNTGRHASTYADSPLVTSYLDDLQVERIMNTAEKQDHLMYQSMSNSISITEYKYRLLLKLCGR